MSDYPLVWAETVDQYSGRQGHVPLIAGWDNNGIEGLACVVGQRTGPMSLQVLREYYNDRMGIIDLTWMVLTELEKDFPGYTCTHYADPAGWAKQSSNNGSGRLTSPSDMQKEICGITLIPSRQDLALRINCVDMMLDRSDGMLIDPSCSRLVNGFQGGYVKEENPRMGIGEFKIIPKQNKFAHIHSALQYLIVPVFYNTMKNVRTETMEHRFITNQSAHTGDSQPVVDFDSRFGR